MGGASGATWCVMTIVDTFSFSMGRRQLKLERKKVKQKKAPLCWLMFVELVNLVGSLLSMFIDLHGYSDHADPTYSPG